MALPERIKGPSCDLARRWILDPHLAEMLVRLEGMADSRFTTSWFTWPGTWIISGYRSPEHQAEINPDVTSSCHTVCPSLAADLRVGSLEGIESDEVWAILGGMWRLMGGRWGGTFTDYDPNHFDLGPCKWTSSIV